MISGYRFDRYIWLLRATNRGGDGGETFLRANMSALCGFRRLSLTRY
jgi:hypothetical protein